MLGIERIQKVIPHRYPFLLVDRILEIVKGKGVATVNGELVCEVEIMFAFSSI